MKKKKAIRWDLTPWEGAVKAERFPHLGNPCYKLGDQLEQKGSFRGSEKSAAAGFQQAEQRETCIRGFGPPHCSPQPEMRIWWCLWDLGDETWAPEDRSRKRTEVGCVESA